MATEIENDGYEIQEQEKKDNPFQDASLEDAAYVAFELQMQGKHPASVMKLISQYFNEQDIVEIRFMVEDLINETSLAEKDNALKVIQSRREYLFGLAMGINNVSTKVQLGAKLLKDMEDALGKTNEDDTGHAIVEAFDTLAEFTEAEEAKYNDNDDDE